MDAYAPPGQIDGVLLLLATLSASAQPALTATWVLDEASDVVEARHASALDDAMASLPWAFRPIAKPFLKGTVRSCAQVELSLQDTAFHVKCDDRRPLDLDLSAAVADFIGDDGGACKLKTTQTDDAVQVSFYCERGGQHDWYKRTADGLEITREVFSPQLPTPIRWTVRYRSAD